MNIPKINRQILKILNTAKTTRKVELGPKEYKQIKADYHKFSQIIGQPLSKIQTLTEGASLNQYTFLRTLVNKFNYEKFHSIDDRSEHILNIYSMVEKPSALHLNIVRKSKDSFESLEKIFSLARDEKSLQYVEDLQYGELKKSKNPSKIIIDLLSSKNRDRFISNPERYSSYIELHANEDDAIKQLDILIESGKFNNALSDAKIVIRKLFKKQQIENVLAGKDEYLAKMYSKDRAKFLNSIIKNFIPSSKAPKEDTKAMVVDMYGSMNADNAALRQAVLEKFKNNYVSDKTAEIVEMQALFSKIDKDKNVKTFVKKAIDKDLKIGSIAELNEIINSAPMKKINFFFNNAKRIIEQSSGKERITALFVELENPFYVSKNTTGKRANMLRMFANKQEKDNLFTKAYKILENKINQFRYYRLSA